MIRFSYQHRGSSRALACIAALLVSTPSAKCNDIKWADPVDGIWTDGVYWLGGVAPTFRDDVELGLFAPYVVQLNILRFAKSLQITNPNAILELHDGSVLRIETGLENDGVIHVHPSASEQVAELRFDSNAALSGQGRLLLDSPQALLQVGTGQMLIHQSPHVIEGEGVLAGLIQNNSLIDANKDNGALILTDDVTNDGVIRASNGSQLKLDDIQIQQGPSGLVEAVGSGSEVLLDSSQIYGGTVKTSDGGRLNSVMSSHLRDVDFVDEFASVGGFYINESRFVNTTIRMDGSTGSYVQFDDTNSFIGQGKFILDGVEARLTFNEGFVLPDSYNIEGNGRIIGAFVNQAMILANTPQESLRISSFQNDGSLGAVNGARLLFNNTRIANQAGEIFVDGMDSRIVIEGKNSFIEGGVLSATGGAYVENNANLFITDTILAAPIHNRPGSNVRLSGLLYTNEVITNHRTR